MNGVLVVGGGRWGKNHVRQFNELGRLDGVVDTSPDRVSAFSEEYGADRVFSDLKTALTQKPKSAIVLATPVSTHFELAKTLLEAGRDVFVEKPITMSTAEAKDLVAIAKEKDLVLMVGHLLIYQPAIARIKELMDEGKIGRILSLHQDRLNLGTARSVENALWSLGVHDVAVLLYLLDSERPNSVVATGQAALGQVEDDVYVHMAFESGPKVHLHNSWLWPVKQRGLTVIGTEGMLVYDEIAQKVIHHKKSILSDLKNRNDGEEVVFEGDSQPLKLEAEHFLECVEKRSTPRSDGASAILVTEVIEIACKGMGA